MVFSAGIAASEAKRSSNAVGNEQVSPLLRFVDLRLFSMRSVTRNWLCNKQLGDFDEEKRPKHT